MSRIRWSEPDGPRALPVARRGEEQASEGMRRLRIGYVPFGGITNKYAERFIEILADFGVVSQLPGPRALLRRPWRLPGRFDVAVLNWIELDLVRRSDGAFSAAGFLKVLTRLVLFRCLARRLVYVRHNNFPHGTRERDIPRARGAVNLLERLCDVVLVHSGHDLGGHRRYIPHPLYRPVETRLDAAERALVARLPMDFYTVFGRIERYKRIEELVSCFPPGQRLVVFGAADDQEYVAELNGMAGSNVRILPGYVSEGLAQAVVRRSRGLVLCHADPDMIVSGSLFYALSLGVRVFAVESPALAWLYERVDPAHLVLAPDVSTLCQDIARDRGTSVAPPVRLPDVEAEFGDARIRAALHEVLRP